MAGRISLILSVLAIVFFAGCTTHTATLELIAVGQEALTLAKEDRIAQHAELMASLGRQKAALDTAFDEDIRFAADGKIKGPSGQVVELTPQWVISARKGYIAARDLVTRQIYTSVHAIKLDNLEVAREALSMASELIIRQAALTDQLKTHLLKAYRRLSND